MDIPSVTREYTPGSCGNSRKPMRHPPHREMRPDSRALRAEQFRVPKHVRILDLLDGTPESPQQCCQETRRTMMSPQKWRGKNWLISGGFWICFFELYVA